MPDVAVPPDRLDRWLENFLTRHGATAYQVVDGSLTGVAADGSHFTATPPFGRALERPEPARLRELCAPPDRWGILLVRKGGFAVALLAGETVTARKVGRRHVQGRTKAGGQSQQRFARRRDNQARQAFEATADHAARVLGPLRGPAAPVVTGGDHAAVEAVLADARLTGLEVVPPFLTVPDPRGGVLDRAILDAAAVRIRVLNA